MNLPQFKFFLRLLGSSSQRKYAWRWLESQTPSYLLEKPSPWITFGAIDYLTRSLPDGIKVFEYGSGGSTLFWLRFNPATVVSVEHDAAWHAEILPRVQPVGLVDYRLIPPDPRGPNAPTPNPADPDQYDSADERWARHSFQRYVTQIDAFPDGYFDVVLVDGRSRPACLRHSAPKVRPGGLLILDQSERSYYLERTKEDLQGFEPNVFAGALPQVLHMTETTVFIRKQGI